MTTTFERGSLLRRSSRRRTSSQLSRSSPDAQTSDEAYCTLSSHHHHRDGRINQQKKTDLRRKGSTSDSSSLSTSAPNCASSPILTISIDDIYTTLDRAQILMKMEDEHIKEDIGRLREIAQQGLFQQSLQLLPLVHHMSERSMDLFHQLLLNHEHGERSFKEMIEEFVQIIEKKLADAEFQMFDTTYVEYPGDSSSKFFF